MPVIETSNSIFGTTAEGRPLPSHQYGPFESAGIPALGYLNGIAEKGALVIDTTNGTLYQNTGTKAATAWTAR